MYKAILFDLDGTLTDSGEGITKSVQYALEKIGHPEPELSKLRSFVGPPLLEQFMSYANIDADTARLAVTYYRERYAPIGVFENAVYPGVEKMLYDLRQKGYLLGVASSKPEMFVIQVLEHFGLKRYFHVIVGSELNGGRSEKEEVVREALYRLHLEDHREQVVLVGDRKYDINGARACGMECIAVSYGYGSVEELRAADPLTIVQSPYEVVRFLSQTPLRRQHPLFKFWRCVYPIGIHFAIAQIIGTAALYFMMALTPQYESMYMNYLLMLTALAGVIFMVPGVFLYRTDQRNRETGRLIPKPAGTKLCLKDAVFYLGLGAAFSMVGNVALSFLQLYLDPSIYGGDIEQAMTGKDGLELLLWVGILAPIAEEVLFRWLVYLRMRDYMKIWPAAILSGLAFAIYHGNLLQGIYTLFFGIFFAYVLEMTGCLWASVLMHIGGNSFSLLISMIPESVDEGLLGLMLLLFLAAAAVLMILGTRYVKKKGYARGYRAI